MIGTMMGQILSLLLESVLRQCFEEDSPAGPIGPLGQSPGSVPIPSLGPAPARLVPPQVPQADMAAWMKDIIDNLTPGQTCSLLRGIATEATLKACQVRTKQDWPLVYNSGIRSYLDIKSFFVDIGQNINLDVCDTIQLAAPVVVDLCTAGFDYESRCAILREAGFHFSPLPIDVKDLVLHGYFQSEKYFEDCREEVKKEFSFRNPQQFTLLENTVSIHVRRGDYMKHPNHHPLCSMDYYNRAMSEFKGYNFLVCTDDKKWCKENFKQDNVQVSLLEDASQELELMSWCEHHIIANSSFSWWSAWLGHNKDKRVVAPAKWFGPAYSHMQTQDLYVEDWLVI